MKRSDMVKKLQDFLGDSEARSSDTLLFLEDLGMTHHSTWDPEEEPTSLAVEEKIFEIVRSSMGWTTTYTYYWYSQSNPLLGGQSPVDLVNKGQHVELLELITPPDTLSSLDIDLPVSLATYQDIHTVNSMLKQSNEEYSPHILPQKSAVKRLRYRYNARRQSIKPSNELRKALKGKKK